MSYTNSDAIIDTESVSKKLLSKNGSWTEWENMIGNPVEK